MNETQSTGTATREVPAEILVALDSHLSWCRHRHRNQSDVLPEMDELIAYLRRGVPPEPEDEDKRTNRIMREVLEDNLARLRAEARKEGWT